MRQIKFRVWDKATKRIIYDCGMNVSGNTILTDKIAIPMQYTGLKDKNGKEIYEGDILKFNIIGGNFQHISKASKVYYEKGCYWVDNEDGICTKLLDVAEVEWAKKEELAEIIGNIYENPELQSPKDKR